MRLNFFFLVIGCFFTHQAHAQPIKLALNWKAEPQFGGFYQSQAQSFFKKNNLQVEITEGGSGTPTIQMLSAKKVDYAVVSADEILVAYDRKAPFAVALFAVFQTNPQGVMTHEARGFKSLEDVFNAEGTLLMQSGLPYAQYLKKKFPKAKVKISPYQGGISNFLSDPRLSQQCFVTSEPIAANRAGTPTKTFLVAEAGYNPYTTVLVVHRDRLKSHPEEVKKMVEAVRLGWEAYLKDPRPAHQKISELNKAMDPETLAKSADAQKILITPEKGLPLGSMTKDRWTMLQKQLTDLGVIKGQFTVDQVFQNF
ncbi:MAG: ABC transporter substrate-binding protein [Proteobacteria bacterium]|nr:ABC transporter substrate-binding protein [Pseudomonadota bacterium]